MWSKRRAEKIAGLIWTPDPEGPIRNKRQGASSRKYGIIIIIIIIETLQQLRNRYKGSRK